MVRAGTTASLLGMAALVLVADQASKAILPIIQVTSRVPLWGMVAAIVVFVVCAYGEKAWGRKILWWAAIGAGIANSLDKLVLGSVRDIFVIGTLSWNVADAVLMGSLLAIIINMLILGKPRQS